MVNFPNLPDISKKPIVIERDTLTVDELAAYWGVTPKSVQHAAWKGEVPGCVRVLGKYIFDKEVVLAGWIPPRVQSWAHELNAAVPIAGGSGLIIEGGKKALQDAAIVRMHDLHVLVTSARWATIILKAVDQATEGDWRARKWLGDYLMGPPVHRVEAEVEVKDSRSFSAEMRSQAIEALLQQARERVTIDVKPNEPAKTNADREVSS